MSLDEMDPEYLESYDINCDGLVDAIDLLKIKRFLMGLSDIKINEK